MVALLQATQAGTADAIESVLSRHRVPLWRDTRDKQQPRDYQGAEVSSKSLGLSEEVMGADPQEEDSLPFDAEGDAVLLGDPAFPEVLVSLHLLDPQRGMPGIGQEERQLFPCSLLKGWRQACIVPLESSGPGKDHRLRSLTRSSTLEKAFTLPALTSRSAARSPVCHSSVHQ